MTNIKKKPLLIGIILISMITMLFTAYERMEVESKNKGVEIILDYKEIESLAKQSDEDLEWWFEEFKKLGVSSVAIEEETLYSLVHEEKELQINIIGNIVKDTEWEKNYSQKVIDYIKSSNVDKYDLMVTSKSKEIADFVSKGISKRYSANLFHEIIEDDNYTIIIDGKEDEALYIETGQVKDAFGKVIRQKKELFSSEIDSIGIGFDKRKIDIIKSSGLKVTPRPINYEEYSEKLVEAYIDEIEELDIKPNVLIFIGKETLGYGSSQEQLLKYLKENDIKIGLIETGVQREHIEQEGIDELTEKSNYNSVRVFSVWNWIQERYKYYNYEGAEEIENTIYRAITERNIRAVYFRPFKENSYEYVTDYEEYEKTFDSLKDRLERHNIILGNATIMDTYRVSPLRMALIGIGLVGFGIILLGLLIHMNRKIENGLTILGIVGVFGAVYFAPSLADKLLSFSASIILPSTSIAYLVKKSRKILFFQNKKDIKSIIIDSIVTLMISVIISLIGGLYVGSILSNITYLLEMEIFRGVKISQLAPIAVFVIFYFSEFGYKRNGKSILEVGIKKDEIKSFLDTGIKIKYFVLSGIVLVIGYIYIARTGHETSVQPSDFEMIVRNFLENVLLARPRTKEFLLAFPALMICIYMAYNKHYALIFPFALVSVIGLTSVANTFSHLRTPLYLSIVRTIYSVGFGMIIGIIGTVCLEIIRRIISPLKGEKLDE